MTQRRIVSAITTPTRVTRRRRILGFAAGGLLLAFGAFALVASYLHWQEQRAWEAACAEADRLDPGWRWEDLAAAGPAVPEERDSARHVLRAVQLLPPKWSGWKVSAAKGNDLKHEFDRLAPNQRLSPQLAAGIRSQLDSVAPALAEANRLADCPEGRLAVPPSPTLRAQTPDYFAFQKVGSDLLYDQLLLQTEAGDFDAALTTARAIVHASRPVADYPSLLTILIAHAIRHIAVKGLERILAQGEPPPAALAALQHVLTVETGRPMMLTALRGERAGWADTKFAFADGRISARDVDDIFLTLPTAQRTGWPAIDRWRQRLFGGGFFFDHLTAEVHYLNWMIERLKESPDSLQEHADEWATVRAALPGVVRTTANMLVRYLEDERREYALLRSAVAALAAERFRQSHGRWPATLDELVPDYLSAVPRDPFDLRPLRLARRPDGIVIYAVGADRQDDGGAVSRVGQTSSRDVGIRLWDPGQRRQPPPPPKTTPPR